MRLPTRSSYEDERVSIRTIVAPEYIPQRSAPRVRTGGQDQRTTSRRKTGLHCVQRSRSWGRIQLRSACDSTLVNMFPPEYRNAIFVARHGSWNRSEKFGGDIAVVWLNDDGTVKSVDPFITFFIENNKYLGRPAGLLFLKDGSMLISDDFNGAVYRVTYESVTVGR